MGQMRKIGEDYYIEFYARGLLYQQKAGPGFDDAKKLLEEIEGKIERGEMNTVVRDIKRDIFFDSFLSYARGEHAPLTYQRFESMLKDFDRFLSENFSHHKKLSEITPQVLERYRSYLLQAIPERHSKNNLVNLTLLLLKEVFEYSRKLGYLNDNPMVHVKFLPYQSRRPIDTLSPQDHSLLLKEANDEFRFLLEFLLATGLRLEEAVNLKWANISLKDYRLSIRLLKDQGRPFREIPVDAFLYERLNKTLYAQPQGYIFTDSNGKVWEQPKLVEMLDLIQIKSNLTRPLNFYTLRNTFIKNMLCLRVSLFDLYKILGFKDVVRLICFARFIPQEKLI